MEYFKINYYRLKNINQIKFFQIVFVLIIIFIILIILSFNKNIQSKVSFSGIYNDNILKIKINNKLSDILNDNEYIVFNNVKTTYGILDYGEYEIIDNEIYQIVNLTVDEKYKDNEVGIVELYYNKQKIFDFILDLFK